MRKLNGVLDNHIKLKMYLAKNGKLTKPKELKGINKITTVKCRGHSYQVFVDKEFNLWYKDNAINIDSNSEIVTNEHGALEVKVNEYYTKGWFKFEGIYEYRKEFILDTVRLMSEVSESTYAENSVSDNVALEDLYEMILKEYLVYIMKY